MLLGSPLPCYAQDMTAAFRTTRLVEFSDTDMAGIMHFAGFFRFMESAEHEMLRSWGFSVFDDYDGQTISFPRVNASCDYRNPVRSEDVLDIEIRVKQVGTSSITYEFHFQLDGLDIAFGELTCVCCRIEPGHPPKSTPIPAGLSEKLHALVDS